MRLSEAKHRYGPSSAFHMNIFDAPEGSKLFILKRDVFDFDIVNFPFLDGDVPRQPSYGVYISQLIRFVVS